MTAFINTIASGSRALACFLGLTVIFLTGLVMATAMEPAALFQWAQRIFGPLFMVALTALIYLSLYSLVKIHSQFTHESSNKVWFEIGLQSANGIATLALTYTLLGISLGIGSLSSHALTPDTIQDVIKGLTKNFSMAFMTTVIGLPLSAVLRALLVVSFSRTQEKRTSSTFKLGDI